jgi:hypothetical protein
MQKILDVGYWWLTLNQNVHEYCQTYDQCQKTSVATPLLEECEDETHIPKMGTWESTRTPKNSEFDCRVKTPCIGVFFISLESYQNIDVENGLA